MNSAIERIINNDRKARDAVASAERYRKAASDELLRKKAKIEADVKAEVAAAVKEAKDTSEKESERKIAEYRRSAEDISCRMDALCSEKMDEWVETYTRRVIEKL